MKTLTRLERVDQRRIQATIDLLADEPRPPGCVKLSGEDAAYRVRVGSFRVLYEVHDHELKILVVNVGHRRDVYRR